MKSIEVQHKADGSSPEFMSDQFMVDLDVNKGIDGALNTRLSQIKSRVYGLQNRQNKGFAKQAQSGDTQALGEFQSASSNRVSYEKVDRVPNLNLNKKRALLETRN